MFYLVNSLFEGVYIEACFVAFRHRVGREPFPETVRRDTLIVLLLGETILQFATEVWLWWGQRRVDAVVPGAIVSLGIPNGSIKKSCYGGDDAGETIWASGLARLAPGVTGVSCIAVPAWASSLAMIPC